MYKYVIDANLEESAFANRSGRRNYNILKLHTIFNLAQGCIVIFLCDDRMWNSLWPVVCERQRKSTASQNPEGGGKREIIGEWGSEKFGRVKSRVP